jgi:gamma-glutamylputrescine oxidase
MRRKMLRVFPQLKDVDIDYAWSGLIDLTLSRLPHIGRLTQRSY